MVHGPDFFMKLMLGEIVAQLAQAQAENEALREQLAAKPKRKTETKKI